MTTEDDFSDSPNQPSREMQFILLLANNPIIKNSPILKSVAIAISCLESGYGRKAFYNNIYGIKCHHTDMFAGCRLGKTSEVIDGKYQHNLSLAFQTYDSINDSIQDFFNLMTNAYGYKKDRYRRVREAKDYIEATQAIKDCGYATSLSYISSLQKIIEKYKLYELDYKMNKNEKLTENFTFGEFWSGDIKLGLKSIEPPAELVNKIMFMAEELQLVRDYINSPIIITSGYRTREWNKHEGGVDEKGKLSFHVQGLAVDVRVTGMKPYDLAVYISKLTDFKGFGINTSKNFVHCDLREVFNVFDY